MVGVGGIVPVGVTVGVTVGVSVGVLVTVAVGVRVGVSVGVAVTTGKQSTSNCHTVPGNGASTITCTKSVPVFLLNVIVPLPGPVTGPRPSIAKSAL
jgi:hypothetical protein